MKVLPINLGYWQYKSLNHERFKTRITEIASDNVQTTNDILKYNDKIYIIGYGKKDISLDKTESDFTKLCVLNMCSRFMTDDFEDFKLVLSSPALTYNEQQLLLPNSLIDDYQVQHNHKNKIINISECTVFPESFLVYLANNPEEYKDSILAIIDIGGYTSTVALLKGGEFDIQNDFVTVSKGMYYVDMETKKHLVSTEHITCSIDDIYFFRNNDFRDVCKDIKPIERIYKNLIDEVIEQCTLKEWDLSSYKILVTGGGGKELFSFVKDNYFKDAVLSKDPIFDNLNGLDIIAREMYGNDNSFEY